MNIPDKQFKFVIKKEILDSENYMQVEFDVIILLGLTSILIT